MLCLIPEKGLGKSKLRQDGVYIQFITCPVIIENWDPTTGCAYNIFRIINDQLFFQFGKSWGVLYDHISESRKNHKGWELERLQKHRVSLQKFCQQLGLDNLSDPFQTAQDIYQLKLEQLDHELLLKENPDLCLESFGKWDLTSPIKSMPFKIIEKDGSCGDFVEYLPDNNLGYIDSVHCNNQCILYYKDDPEVVYGIDKWLEDDSPNHPYIFYQVDKDLANQSQSFQQYYQQWVASKNITGCEKFELLFRSHFGSDAQICSLVEEVKIPMDPHATDRVTLNRQCDCDICGKSYLMWIKEGIYTCLENENDKDCCISCAVTPEGQKFLADHKLIFYKWTEYNFLSYLHQIAPKIDQLFRVDRRCRTKDPLQEWLKKAFPSSVWDPTVDGAPMVLIRYKNSDHQLTGFRQGRLHGESLTQIGSYYPKYKRAIYLNGQKIVDDSKSNDEYLRVRQLWKDGWMGHGELDYLLPDEFLELDSSYYNV